MSATWPCVDFVCFYCKQTINLFRQLGKESKIAKASKLAKTNNIRLRLSYYDGKPTRTETEKGKNASWGQGGGQRGPNRQTCSHKQWFFINYIEPLKHPSSLGKLVLLKQKYTKQKHHPQAKSDEAMMMAYAQWMKIRRKKVWIIV